MEDAIKEGFVSEENSDNFSGTLIQIMNEAEQQRQKCLNQMDALRKQLATTEGQAVAFGMMHSVIFSVLNNYVSLAEKTRKEEEQWQAERAEIQMEQEKLKLQQDQGSAQDVEQEATEQVQEDSKKSKRTKK
jgi:hypothetical protein